MRSCPVCRDEFEDDVDRCPTDDVDLVPADELPPAPVADASLGVFHPAVAVVCAPPTILFKASAKLRHYNHQQLLGFL